MIIEGKGFDSETFCNVLVIAINDRKRNRRRSIVKLKERAQNLKTDIPAIYLALRDRETPVAAKVMAAITVIYALSPIDLIPDFIPVLGYLDDIILLPALAAATIRLIPDEVLDRCRSEAINLWADGKPKKWYYALPVVVFWLLVVAIIVKAIWF